MRPIPGLVFSTARNVQYLKALGGLAYLVAHQGSEAADLRFGFYRLAF
jgi:hypothetical protein